MTTLSENAIYFICLTADLVSELLANQSFYRLIRMGVDSAIRCLDEGKPEDAQRIIVKTNAALHGMLARQGVTEEAIRNYLQTEQVRSTIRDGLKAGCTDIEAVDEELVDFFIAET
jgi:hypothetical protein